MPRRVRLEMFACLALCIGGLILPGCSALRTTPAERKTQIGNEQIQPEARVLGIAARPAKSEAVKGPGSIVFMVPDGMGLSNVTAARIHTYGANTKERLCFERFENIGYQSTSSRDATVTDSAAAASAWACGAKFNNGEISCHGLPDGSCADLQPTILEMAENMGKSTGLVATPEISHATPAAFGAHVIARSCGCEIARQYIAVAGVDVILGGGIYKTSASEQCAVYPESYNTADKRQYIIDLAAGSGYAFVATETDLRKAVETGAGKILGLFEQNPGRHGKTPEMFRLNGSIYPDGEPTLAEMTAAALDVLEEDPDGFFLLLEGSQVDWRNHANDITYQLAEMIGFDEAVKEVIRWLDANPARKSNTLVIVVADHDCGGFGINGPDDRPAARGEIFDGANENGKRHAGWTSREHTAQDTIIWSRGPLSERLNRALDNTDVYHVMKEALR